MESKDQPAQPKRVGDLVFKNGKLELVQREILEKERRDKIRVTWEDSNRADAWAQESGGIDLKDRNLVKQSLVGLNFYQGLDQSSRILDLAVGAQSYIDKSLVNGASIDAVDMSSTMLSQLKSHQPDAQSSHIHFITAEGRMLPFMADRYDRILSSFMMRYLNTSEQLETLLEMARVSKKGAEIHVVDFDTVDFINQVGYFLPNELIAMSLSKGFEKELVKMGKKINFGADNIDRGIKDGSASKLYHMVMLVSATHNT